MSLIDDIRYMYEYIKFAIDFSSISKKFMDGLNKKYGDYTYSRIFNSLIYTKLDDQESLLKYIKKDDLSFKDGVTLTQTNISSTNFIYMFFLSYPANFTDNERKSYKLDSTLSFTPRERKEIAGIVRKSLNFIKNEMTFVEFEQWYDSNILNNMAYPQASYVKNIMSKMKFRPIYFIPAAISKTMAYISIILPTFILRYIFNIIAKTYVPYARKFYDIDNILQQTINENKGAIVKMYANRNYDLKKTPDFLVVLANGLGGTFMLINEYIKRNTNGPESPEDLYNYVRDEDINVLAPQTSVQINQDVYEQITNDKSPIPPYDGINYFSVTYFRTTNVFNEQLPVSCSGKNIVPIIALEVLNQLFNKYNITTDNDKFIFSKK